MNRLTERAGFRRSTAVAIAAMVIAIASQMYGQSQGEKSYAPMSFEVASVKPVAPPFPSGGGPWTAIHGRFIAKKALIRGVIGWAYDVIPVQVHGAPLWIYDFSAKAEDANTNQNQLREMMRTLLAERFKLVVHRETQEAHVYSLTVGKNGSKMQPMEEGQKTYINWPGPGHAIFTGVAMLGLINFLSEILGSPVVDQTGLKGRYNFSLEYADPRSYGPESAQLTVDSPPDIITAVQEQLGLKVEATKGPVEILVVDHIEKASEN